MKVAWAQLNFCIGDFESNTKRIIQNILKAKAEEVDLIVFSELAVCGYPPLDQLQSQTFLNACQESIAEISKHCINIAAIIGAPEINKNAHGKKLFNAAYFIENQQVKKIIRKTLLPNYDVFDESRYFEPNNMFELISLGNAKIALTICEDLWDDHSKLYTISPLQELMKLNPDFIVNIAASPFHYSQHQIRQNIIQEKALKYKIPVLYVNQFGAQTDLIFDGGSCAVNAQAQIIAQAPFFKQHYQSFQIFDNKSDFKAPAPTKVELMYEALICGVHDFFTKQNFNKAVLGLSGGIDSALTLVLAVEALGKENVLAVLLPSAYSTDHSVNDALQLAQNLGCKHEVLPIEQSFTTILQTLKPQFKETPFNLAEENIQARLRGLLLMALSNKFGYILLNTSNKSEMAVGYGTLYGDMCGGLAVIGDVYKTEVYDLCRYINRKKEIIPINTIHKPPSAELRHNQKDSDSLPEYDVLDMILKLYIEEQRTIQEITENGFDKALVESLITMVNKNEYKRKQAPPVLRLSPKAFGTGRRIPLVAKY